MLEDIADRIAAVIGDATVNPLYLLTTRESHNFHIRMTATTKQITVKISNHIAFIHDPDCPVNH